MKNFITLRPVRISSDRVANTKEYVHLGEIAIRKENIVSIAKANYPNIILITGAGDAEPADCVFLKVTYKVNEVKYEEIIVDEEFENVINELEVEL